MSIYSESRQLQSALDALNREQSANCRLVAQLEAANAENTLLRAALEDARHMEQRVNDLCDLVLAPRNPGESTPERVANLVTIVRTRRALDALGERAGATD